MNREEFLAGMAERAAEAERQIADCHHVVARVVGEMQWPESLPASVAEAAPVAEPLSRARRPTNLGLEKDASHD